MGVGGEMTHVILLILIAPDTARSVPAARAVIGSLSIASLKNVLNGTNGRTTYELIPTLDLKPGVRCPCDSDLQSNYRPSYVPKLNKKKSLWNLDAVSQIANHADGRDPRSTQDWAIRLLPPSFFSAIYPHFQEGNRSQAHGGLHSLMKRGTVITLGE
ncbi:hypothetical protein B0H11DRAFT_1905029 [Mycena galericulata]|nr:hypothetical protein B0H11DRAFT_1905029 [Mycena galericulata]